ncbi:MAG: protease inhibitor I42 family protein [Kiritimatiellia bacterium]
MNKMLSAVPLLSAIFLTNCALSGPARLTEADNASTNSVKAGEGIEIVLKGNPTTGYEWILDSSATNKLQQVGKAEYLQDQQAGKNLRVGVGGQYVFKFKAVEQGAGNIKLVYRRSWETTDCDRVYSVDFDIK